MLQYRSITRYRALIPYLGSLVQQSCVFRLLFYFHWSSVPRGFCEGYEQLEFTRHTNLTPEIKKLKLYAQEQIDILKSLLEVTQPTNLTQQQPEDVKRHAQEQIEYFGELLEAT